VLRRVAPRAQPITEIEAGVGAVADGPA
jgi:hypothetical protein